MDLTQVYQGIRPRYAELRDQVAVVTGSGRGIGKGIALRLAREGMRVVINSNIPEDVQTTVDELTQLGAHVLGISSDLSQTEGVQQLIDGTVEAWGTVDLLVNNAADLRRKHFFDMDEELLDYELNLNIKGPYLCALRAAELMRRQGHGNIVNISSVGGDRAHWHGLPYDVTKGAIDSMTRAMALELADVGIRVNAVAPGAIYTRGWEQPVGEKVAEFVRRIPIQRFGLPTDIAAMIAFLASDDASYITGQVIYVDGGLTSQLGSRDAPQ
ncbi:MAG: glucose 1-dehydrogenase [Herpetosiphonaceae bacterium]|nr:glucose 1-dehydrogenase [Herpetosiphonaceae bacterium]